VTIFDNVGNSCHNTSEQRTEKPWYSGVVMVAGWANATSLGGFLEASLTGKRTPAKKFARCGHDPIIPAHRAL
jgi:hypothetical protein